LTVPVTVLPLAAEAAFWAPCSGALEPLQPARASAATDISDQTILRIGKTSIEMDCSGNARKVDVWRRFSAGELQA
jgi:hypothetical protein